MLVIFILFIGNLDTTSWSYIYFFVLNVKSKSKFSLYNGYLAYLSVFIWKSAWKFTFIYF